MTADLRPPADGLKPPAAAPGPPAAHREGPTAGDRGRPAVPDSGGRRPSGLRPATEEDLPAMLRWRNHPQVRAVSNTRHEIGGAEHTAWWRGIRRDPNRRVLVHRYDGRDAGVVTFSGLLSPERSLVWGFYLDIAGLDERRELLPAWMSLEEAAIGFAFTDLRARSLGGETFAENRPVLALHRRFGFRIVRRYERDVDGTPHQVVWTEMSRET